MWNSFYKSNLSTCNLGIICHMVQWQRFCKQESYAKESASVSFSSYWNLLKQDRGEDTARRVLLSKEKSNIIITLYFPSPQNVGQFLLDLLVLFRFTQTADLTVKADFWCLHHYSSKKSKSALYSQTINIGTSDRTFSCKSAGSISRLKAKSPWEKN